MNTDIFPVLKLRFWKCRK